MWPKTKNEKWDERNINVYTWFQGKIPYPLGFVFNHNIWSNIAIYIAFFFLFWTSWYRAFRSFWVVTGFTNKTFTCTTWFLELVTDRTLCSAELLPCGSAQMTELFSAEHRTFFILHSMLMASYHIFIKNMIWLHVVNGLLFPTILSYHTLVSD